MVHRVEIFKRNEAVAPLVIKVFGLLVDLTSQVIQKDIESQVIQKDISCHGEENIAGVGGLCAMLD